MEMTPPEGTGDPFPPPAFLHVTPWPEQGFLRPWVQDLGRQQVPSLGMLVLLLPAAVELLAWGGEQARRMAKGSMWGKPARGKIDI